MKSISLVKYLKRITFGKSLKKVSDLSDFKIPGQITAEKSATAINLRLPEHQFDLGFTIERRDKLVLRGFTNKIIFISKVPKDQTGLLSNVVISWFFGDLLMKLFSLVKSRKTQWVYYRTS